MTAELCDLLREAAVLVNLGPHLEIKVWTWLEVCKVMFGHEVPHSTFEALLDKVFGHAKPHSLVLMLLLCVGWLLEQTVRLVLALAVLLPLPNVEVKEGFEAELAAAVVAYQLLYLEIVVVHVVGVGLRLLITFGLEHLRDREVVIAVLDHCVMELLLLIASPSVPLRKLTSVPLCQDFLDLLLHLSVDVVSGRAPLPGANELADLRPLVAVDSDSLEQLVPLSLRPLVGRPRLGVVWVVLVNVQVVMVGLVTVSGLDVRGDLIPLFWK